MVPRGYAFIRLRASPQDIGILEEGRASNAAQCFHAVVRNVLVEVIVRKFLQ